MGGKGFEIATNEYSMRGHGELCFNVSVSDPKYKRNILVHYAGPTFPSSTGLFSQQTISFLRTTLAHLPAPTDYGRPSHKYKPNRPSIKLQVDPTLKTSHTTDVTKLRFHMTSHFRMSRTHTHRTHT